MTETDTIPLSQDLTDLLRLQRREVAGLTQKGAALAAGVMSEIWWRQIESGHAKTAPAETLARMAYAIDVTPQQLRNIGQDRVAELVERRRTLLEPEPDYAPQSELEAYLMATPGLSLNNRLVLVSVASGLLLAENGEPSASIAG